MTAHEMTREGQATPREELERQIMSSLVPKNEREHWAAREIESLREQVKMLRETLSGLVKAIDAAEYSTQFQMNLRIAEEALAATEQNP